MSPSNFHPTLTNPAPAPHLDDEDEDEEKESLARKQGTPVAMLVQKKFLEQRKLFLWGAVTDETAKELTEKLLYLEGIAPGKDITFYMNTPGGSITAGMAVYDTMKLITSPITVVVTGMAASMGSILLCAAPKGRRLLYPHSRVLIHQPLISGRMVGPATDINIQAKEMEKIRQEAKPDPRPCLRPAAGPHQPRYRSRFLSERRRGDCLRPRGPDRR